VYEEKENNKDEEASAKWARSNQWYTALLTGNGNGNEVE
jgi:rhamnogalacturonyl hydrolase YesR